MATIHQSRLGAFYGYQESSFATIQGTLGSFTPIPYIIDSTTLDLQEPSEQPGRAIQRLDQREAPVLMPRSASFQHDVNLETFTTAAAASIAATQHWLGTMLECVMKGKRLGTGTTNTTGATTTTMTLTSAASFRAGMPIGMVNPTTGLLECRVIKSISSNSIVLKMAFSFTPADSAVVYAPATYFLHNNPNGVEPTYFQGLMLGYDKKDRWQLPGGTVKGLSLKNLGPNGMPRVGFDWQFPTWLPADGTNGTVSSVDTTLPKQTYTDIKLNTMRGSDTRIRAYGTSSLSNTQLQATTLEITPKIEYEQIPSPNGPFNCNVRGARRREVFPDDIVNIKFGVPRENTTLWDDYATNGTALAFTQQIGSTLTGGAVLIEVPRLYVRGKPSAVTAIGAISGTNVEMFAGDDREATAAGGADEDDTAMAEAALRISFFGTA